MSKILKKRMELTLGVMALSFPMQANSAQLSDIQSHWAEQTIEEFAKNGILFGYDDGIFKPSSGLTRAELATCIQNIFHLQDFKDAKIYTDVAQNAWYSEAITAISSAGIMNDYGNTFAPNAQATREEVIYALVQAYNLIHDNQTTSLNFTDSSQISSWAKDAVETLVTHGYLEGSPDGSLGIQDEITRAEAITLFSRLTAELIAQSGAYSIDTDGHAIINTTDVVLKDSFIQGNLYLTQGIGEGEVFLENVTVQGIVYIEGCGDNTVYLKDCDLNFMVIDKYNDTIRISTDKNTTINSLEIISQANIGGYAKISELWVHNDITIDTNIDISTNKINIETANTTVNYGNKTLTLDENSNMIVQNPINNVTSSPTNITTQTYQPPIEDDYKPPIFDDNPDWELDFDNGLNTDIDTNIDTNIDTYIDTELIIQSPTTDIEAGEFNSSQTISLSTITDDAKIYYTLDGSTPTKNSTLYTKPILIEETATLKAMAIKGDLTSEILTEVYQINFSNIQCEMPTLSIIDGLTNKYQTITLDCDTDNVSIYYTTDGTIPTENSTLYNGAFNITKNCELKIISVHKEYETSDVTSVFITIEPTTYDDYVEEILRLVNIEREKEGLSALLLHEDLTTIAHIKSSDMALNDVFSHTSPYFGSAGELLGVFDINWTARAENIATGQTSPEAVVNAWLESSGHRANILSSSTTHIGIGYSYNANDHYKHYWTQIFIKDNNPKIDEPIEFEPENSTSSTDLEDYLLTQQPNISIKGATFNNPQTIELSTNIDSANIYYTLDNQIPTINSTQYVAPILIEETATLQAVIEKNGLFSKVLAEQFIINLEQVTTPNLTIISGEAENSNYQTVILDCYTDNSTIFYTTDGTDPTENSTLYTGEITITQNTQLKILATKENAIDSEIKEVFITIDPQINESFVYELLQLINNERAKYNLEPLILHDKLTTIAHIKSTDMALNNELSHTSSYFGDAEQLLDIFKIDWWTMAENIAYGQKTPETVLETWLNSEEHKANILSSSTTHIGIGYYNNYWTQIFIEPTKTIAELEKDLENLDETSEVDNEILIAQTPTANIIYGVTTDQNIIELHSDTENAEIFYTLDGSTPTQNSQKYESSFAISETTLLKAIAVAPDMQNSSIFEQTYTINLNSAQIPISDISGGEYDDAQLVALYSLTDWATIYYTLDGFEPNEDSLKYVEPILIEETTILKAIAIANNMENSDIMEETYIILQTVAPPIASVIGGEYDSIQTVELSSITPNATIFYTLNGLDPVVNGEQYSEPIIIENTTILRAIAHSPQTEISKELEEVYIISLNE
ncbi:MAG: hypothetical protein ATN36_08000 [Epulopiscium sp. Nele67-Bin005]|nr:MAG: hypothetical protein ATN36_08000 [Epulopiscium sp. Nele67-Bin005]